MIEISVEDQEAIGPFMELNLLYEELKRRRRKVKMCIVAGRYFVLKTEQVSEKVFDNAIERINQNLAKESEESR